MKIIVKLELEDRRVTLELLKNSNFFTLEGVGSHTTPKIGMFNIIFASACLFLFSVAFIVELITTSAKQQLTGWRKAGKRYKISVFFLVAHFLLIHDHKHLSVVLSFI